MAVLSRDWDERRGSLIRGSLTWDPYLCLCLSVGQRASASCVTKNQLNCSTYFRRDVAAFACTLSASLFKLKFYFLSRLRVVLDDFEGINKTAVFMFAEHLCTATSQLFLMPGMCGVSSGRNWRHVNCVCARQVGIISGVRALCRLWRERLHWPLSGSLIDILFSTSFMVARILCIGNVCVSIGHFITWATFICLSEISSLAVVKLSYLSVQVCCLHAFIAETHLSLVMGNHFTYHVRALSGLACPKPN